jgi:hypothetical protein
MLLTRLFQTQIRWMNMRKLNFAVALLLIATAADTTERGGVFVGSGH